MDERPLRVDVIEAIGEEEFLLYFSDDTTVTVTAQELASLFPMRETGLPRSK